MHLHQEEAKSSLVTSPSDFDTASTSTITASSFRTAHVDMA
jgi:hypothetical protein